jgi:hypothetical protein
VHPVCNMPRLSIPQHQLPATCNPTLPPTGRGCHELSCCHAMRMMVHMRSCQRAHNCWRCCCCCCLTMTTSHGWQVMTCCSASHTCLVLHLLHIEGLGLKGTLGGW